MSREAIRVALTREIVALRAASPYTDTIIEFDNQIVVNTADQSAPFINVRIKIPDVEQADLSSNPTMRWWGVLEFAVAVPKGSGSSKAFKILDYFTPKLQAKTIDGVRMLRATGVRDQEQTGWIYYGMAIAFVSDHKTT